MTAKNPLPAPATTDETPENDDKRFKFKYLPLIAAVPASIISAVIGSRLGVQGTVFGAAVGSVVFGVVNQFTTFGLERSHESIKVVVARRGPDGEVELDEADADGAPRPDVPPEPVVAPAVPVRRTRRVRPALAIAGALATALATFGVTMAVISAGEAATGRSLDGGYTSTVSGASGKATKKQSSLNATTEPSASPSPQPETTTSEPAPTPTAPVVEPTPAPTTSTTTTTTAPPDPTPAPATTSKAAAGTEA